MPLLDDTLVYVAEARLEELLAAKRLGTLPPEAETEIPHIMRTLASRPGLAHLILMTGLPGAGKTALAREIEAQGFLRLCPDEQVWHEHGHYGRDFPRGEYRVRERPILEQMQTTVRDALAGGRDVVMDHGFWTAAEREEWRRVGEQAGAVVILVYLTADHDERWSRIKERNRNTLADPNAMFFSEDDLRRFAGRFEPPGPDEPHVTYDGDSAPVLAVLQVPTPRTSDT